MFGLFKRTKRKIADEELGDNDEEAEVVVSIRARCEAGTVIARELSDASVDRAARLARYESIRDDCIMRADKLADEYYRGVAIHHIIDMCAAAGDMGVARALVLAVQDEFLREQIFASVPALKDKTIP